MGQASAKQPTFEHFNTEWVDRVKGAKARSGIDGFLGIVVTDVAPGRLVAEMEVTKALMTVMGNMHGGCLSALCDHVLGTVMYPVMPPKYWAATTEFKINLLAPVTTGVCRATADIIAMTRRMAVVRIEVENEGRLVAAAQGTCTIVAPRPDA
ncbi:MAG TPA: PaaI family thioesterase [Caulobacteraceae bacterium]|nr:PaaI family thioesterase [Caulobacteraceae bacterium]